MALIGTLATVKNQLIATESLKNALRYVEEALAPGSAVDQRIQALALGQTERVELGDGLFALEQAYLSKPRGEGVFESHRAYIDVQVIVSGEELMELTEVARLNLREDFTPERDLIFYADFRGGSVLRIQAGELAIFHPTDAHMPSLAVDSPQLVRKTVVKVPVAAR